MYPLKYHKIPDTKDEALELFNDKDNREIYLEYLAENWESGDKVLELNNNILSSDSIELLHEAHREKMAENEELKTFNLTTTQELNKDSKFHRMHHNPENGYNFDEYRIQRNANYPVTLTINGKEATQEQIERLEATQADRYFYIAKGDDVEIDSEALYDLVNKQKMSVELINTGGEFYTFKPGSENIYISRNGDNNNGWYIKPGFDSDDELKRFNTNKDAEYHKDYSSLNEIMSYATTRQQSKEEQLSKQVDDKLDSLINKLDDPNTEKEVKDFLKSMNQFHNYSFNNQMLLHIQASQRDTNITKVASFEKWRKVQNEDGKRVAIKSGEKGYKVFVPVKYKNKVDSFKDIANVKSYLKDRGINSKNIKTMQVHSSKELYLDDDLVAVQDGKDLTVNKAKLDSKIDDIREKIVAHIREKHGDKRAETYLKYSADKTIYKKGLAFKVGNVFDIGQTNAKDIGAIKDLAYRDKDAEISPRLFDDMKKAIEDKYPVTVEVKDTGSNAKGYYDKTNSLIVVDPNATDSSKVSTLFHELGHHMMHSDLDYREIHLTRGQREGEAEAFAYAMASNFGIENNSELYISTWQNTPESMRESFTTISQNVKLAHNDLGITSYLENNKEDVVENTLEELKEALKEPEITQEPKEEVAVNSNFHYQ